MDFLQATDEVFQRFNNQFALATAGSIEDFDGCTIGWGSVGSLWGFIRKGKKVVTIYVNPARYTSEYLLKNDTFTVSFFPPEYERDLMLLGSKSGRDGDKFALTRLTPEAHGDTVTFREAELTLVCHKLYWEQFDPAHVDPAVMQNIYARIQQPTHYQFIGEITEVIDQRAK